MGDHVPLTAKQRCWPAWRDVAGHAFSLPENGALKKTQAYPQLPDSPVG